MDRQTPRRVAQPGPARYGCARKVGEAAVRAMSEEIISALTETLRARREAAPEDSYVASLYAAGIDRILEKLGEEAVEVLLAGKNSEAGDGRDSALVREVADLWFHSMVLLVHQGQDPAWVLDELAGRFGVSGHAEKAQRPYNEPS